MRRLTLVLSVFFLAGVACSRVDQVAPSSAALSGPGGTEARQFDDKPVTTTIEDLDSHGQPADLYSDGLGPYIHNVGGVRSVLAQNAVNGLNYGDWQFDASSSRLVGTRLDHEEAIQPGDAAYLVPATPPFWGPQILPAILQVMCTSVNRSMLTMTPGSTFTCGLLQHDILYNGVRYGRPMAPIFTGYPETTDAQITCNAADAGGCTDWVIEPIGQGRAIARLMGHFAKPNKPPTHIGSFYVRFRIHITRP